MTTKKTKNTIKPHTEAKLKFYMHYLERYLEILIKSQFVKKINVYDLYSGAAIYDDGKEGSSIRTHKLINNVILKNKPKTEINLTLNDLNKKRFMSIKEETDKIKPQYNKLSIQNKDAISLTNDLIKGFRNKQNKKTKNLVFIDPYGYKNIDKSQIKKLLENGRTEVIIFLPISQMYRFKTKTQEKNVEKSYIPLKNFIEEFKIDISKSTSDKKLIKQIERSLNSNNEYYSTSYHIKNQKGTHYALFFITSNIKGLEKINEVKWSLDQRGEGFDNEYQKDLFIKLEKINTLKNMLLEYLSTERTNKEIYEFTILNGFIPKHSNQILKALQREDRLVIYPEKTRKGSFYNNYKNYSKKEVVISIKLQKNYAVAG